MVKFGVLTIENVWSGRDLKSYSKDPYLIITTNVINREILNMIDTEDPDNGVKNLIFQVPNGPNRDITFDIDLQPCEWAKLERIEYLEFNGKLANKQFKAVNLSMMPRLRALYIGATSYSLFDGEDISVLTMIPHVTFNGYGLVEKSENLNKWIEKLQYNRCIVSHYI